MGVHSNKLLLFASSMLCYVFLLGCASVTPTTVPVPSPMPEAPAGAKYHIYGIGKFKELSPNEATWRSAGYVIDMPDFPLPLFSDPNKKDVTTAHLTFCAYGTSKNGMFEFVATEYYDETPDGDFTNLDSLCGDEEEVRVFGGDRSKEPYDPSQGYVRTIVDRSALVEGPDGRSVMYPAPQGTEFHATWKHNSRTGLDEIWVFAFPSPESGMAPGTN